MIRAFLMSLFCLLFSCAKGQPGVSCQNPKFDKKIRSLLSFTVPVLSPDQLENMGKDVLILDAREQKEFDVSHLPNAQFIGYKHFKKNDVAKFDKSKPVVVYCSVGYRSEKIGERLQKMGFEEVYNLYGSIFEWANQGKPLVDNKGTKTTKVHTWNKKWSKWIDNTTIQKVW